MIERIEKQNSIDWMLFGLVAIVSLWGLLTLFSFSATNNVFEKQLVLVSLGGVVMLVGSFFNYRFLRHSWVIMTTYVMTVISLVALLVYGSVFSGAQSWFAIGSIAIQPSEFAKVVLVLLLAKYFSKRHIEIASFRHVVVSGMYALILCVLTVLQSDFGSAVILFLIWFGMVLLAGINWKQVLSLVGAGILGLVLMWFFVFSSYQQTRIITFVNPDGDLLGAGYNSRQAEIAVGSGGWWGKGIGYGSQSRLSFLPQYDTDFIVAAFAEEWGFLGTVVLLALYLGIAARLVFSGMYGETNFEMLFAGGVAIYFMTHVIVHAGINIGLLPVTGITIPFMSSGGSHIMAESIAVGMVFGMRRYRRTIHRQGTQSELYTHT